MGIFSKNFVGIDIGASSIKVVELSLSDKKSRLKNYAKFSLPENGKVKIFQSDGTAVLSQQSADVIRAILEKAGIKEKKVAFSIPDFSTFFTTFSLPPMNKEEIPKAVEFEARHHIPLPLQEVSFDWQIIKKEQSFPGLSLKILLVAVPNKVLESYQRVAALSGVELNGMEAEVFGALKSSIPESLSKKPVCLVDIGWQSTTVSVVENMALKESYSFDISSKRMSEMISSALSVSFAEGEKIKIQVGLDPQKKEVINVLLPEINSLAFEINKVANNYFQEGGNKIENIILTGGTAPMFGLKEYISEKTKRKTIIANPFLKTQFPSILDKRLQSIGPSFSVALGVAMMGA